MLNKFSKIRLLLVVFWIFACSNEKVETVDLSKKLEQSAISNDKKGEFHVAVSAMTSPKQTLQYYQDLIRYLAEHLDLHPHFVQRKTYKEINDLLAQKRLDCAFICSGAFVDARLHQIPLKLLAVPLIDQKTEYHSIIIVNKDIPAKNLNDLRGSRFAFTDPMSNTGYRYLKYELKRRGESEKRFFASSFFTYGHDNSIQAVNRGIADAACVDELIYNYLRENNEKLTANTKIVHRSPAFGIPPLVSLKGNHDQMDAKIQNILFHMHEDSTGREILQGLHIEKFVLEDESIYDEVKKMYQATQTVEEE